MAARSNPHEDLAAQVFGMLKEGGVAKAALRRRFREDSCINSTRVLFDVYRAVGIPAETVAVRTRIYSPGFVSRAHREGRMPKDVHSWTSEPGVWSVGIGYGFDPRNDKWPGHLVLRSCSHLIDATIDQANRPHHGIVMPPMLLVPNVADEFWRAEKLLGVEINGCQVAYEARPNDNSYLSSPVWSSSSPALSGGRPDIEGAVAAELLRHLESKGVERRRASG